MQALCTGCGEYYDFTPTSISGQDAEWPMESNEFHWKDGWRFRLQECGCIRIQKFTGQRQSAQALIPAVEWDSVVSFIAQVRQAATVSEK
jgi:hypothetical protein